MSVWDIGWLIGSHFQQSVAQWKPVSVSQELGLDSPRVMCRRYLQPPSTLINLNTRGFYSCCMLRQWRGLVGKAARSYAIRTEMGKTRKNFYAVRVGREVGVYRTWWGSTCSAQTPAVTIAMPWPRLISTAGPSFPPGRSVKPKWRSIRALYSRAFTAWRRPRPSSTPHQRHMLGTRTVEPGTRTVEPGTHTVEGSLAAGQSCAEIWLFLRAQTPWHVYTSPGSTSTLHFSALQAGVCLDYS